MEPPQDLDRPDPGAVPDDQRVRPIDLRDYVDFDEDEARRIRVLATADLAMDLWCIEPQQSTPVLHYEDGDVAYTVIGGRSWFVTEEGEIGLDPMGAMLVPAGIVHGIDNRGADPLVVVAGMAPPDTHDLDAPVVREMEAVRDEESLGGAMKRAMRTLLGGDAGGGD